MTPKEQSDILNRVDELLEIVDCLVQTAVPEDCYAIHNEIDNLKDSVLELNARIIHGETK
jgi:hypothetical protein